MTRLLLAGTGLIGHRHLRHILELPDLELAGIIDPVTQNRDLADVPGFASIEEVNVEADGIVIATPTATHAPLVAEAARRGWHVMVEKPVAESLEAADGMIKAADAAGIKISGRTPSAASPPDSETERNSEFRALGATGSRLAYLGHAKARQLLRR